jgi:anti-sigma factor RsiW
VRSRLGRYLRGRLSRNARAHIAAHLDRCRSCNACLAELKELYGFRVDQAEGDQ